MEFPLFERERRDVPPGPVAEPFFLYGDAWKKFDKLHKAIKGSGASGWIYRTLDLVMGGTSLYGLHLKKHYVLLILAAWVLAYAIGLSRLQTKKKEFLHWSCPRCHAEWPGSKTDKDSKCKSCGLRLHQLNP